MRNELPFTSAVTADRTELTVCGPTFRLDDSFGPAHGTIANAVKGGWKVGECQLGYDATTDLLTVQTCVAANEAPKTSMLYSFLPDAQKELSTAIYDRFEMNFTCMNGEEGTYSTTTIDMTKEMEFATICADKQGLGTVDDLAAQKDLRTEDEAVLYSKRLRVYNGDQLVMVCKTRPHRPDFKMFFHKCIQK